MLTIQYKGRKYALISIPGLGIVFIRILRLLLIRIPFGLLVIIFLVFGFILGLCKQQIFED